jgi:hypothetical protein
MNSRCSALWIGPELGPLHAACLRSFGRLDVPITLYVYERPIDVPSNVELADAGAIVPKDKIFRDTASGSFAHFADLFRYILLSKVPTLYVDVDIYCLRPISDRPYIYGWEDDERINNAVLKLPPESELLASILKLSRRNFLLPSWCSRKNSILAMMKHIVLGGPTIAYLDWAAIGPLALTHFIRQLQMADRAMSTDYFYPIHWSRLDLLLQAGARVADLVSPNTECVHLYNSKLKALGYQRAPASSPIREMLEGRVEL